MDDHYDEIVHAQRLRTEASRVKMDALIDLRNMAADPAVAVFLVAHLAIRLPGADLAELVELASEYRAMRAGIAPPQD